MLETDLEAMLELDPLPAVELPGHGPRSPSAILYTSGSSGTPKGVVIPAGALPTVGAGYAGCFGITERDNYFLPLPLAHAVGALTPQGIALHARCRLTVVDRFSPSRFWTDVEASRATCSILFPAQLNLLLELAAGQPAASSLRLVMTHVWSSRFRDRFGVDIGVCWGMTETGAHSTGSPAGRHTERGDGYVGRPMLGVEIAVLGSGRTPLGSGETGEIALRHPHVMLEYLKDPEQTTRTLVDGWILSGDLGTIGEDGGLYYAGRSKNMIKRSGENISPEEIEGAIARYPAVVEALVFGVADPIRTEEIAAVIVVRPGAATEADDIIGHLRDHLARWKLPRYVALGEAALPRLANGKIDRMSVISSLDTATCWDRERTPKEAPTR